jgi:hypothetical protein
MLNKKKVNEHQPQIICLVIFHLTNIQVGIYKLKEKNGFEISLGLN